MPLLGLQSAPSLAAVQARQSRVLASQIGVRPEQSALLRQPTQVSVPESHTGFAPKQADPFAAVHSTHSP